MDNAQKAIMIGVGLFITIIVIAAVMLITGMGQDLLNSGTQQLSGVSDTLRRQITDQYHEKVLTTSQVRTAMIDLLNRDSVIVNLQEKGEKGAKYTIVKTNSSDDTKRTSEKTVNEALTGKNTNQKFKGWVEYDDTTGIATVTFIEQ